MGHKIGEKGPIAVRMAKECINAADEMTLCQGLMFERRNFHALFATNDQKEVRKNDLFYFFFVFKRDVASIFIFRRGDSFRV